MKNLRSLVARPLLTCFTLVAFFICSKIEGQVLTIAEARQLPLNSTATVRGIITSGAELGQIRYLQDPTAGIAAFPLGGGPAGFSALKPGDSVEITGKIINYLNLLEFSPVTAFKIISEQNPLPPAKKIRLADIGEAFESQLVEVDCITFDEAGDLFSSVGNYPVKDTEGAAANIRITSSTSPFLGTSIPEESVRLTAVVNHFQNQYQLLPRLFPDFQLANKCFYISQQPFQTKLSAAGFTVNWQTNLAGFSMLKFGDSPQNLSQEVPATAIGGNYSADLTTLTAGKIYWVQAIASKNQEIAQSEIIPMATVSNSSGQMLFFFNHAVDTQTGGGGIAPTGQTPDAALDYIIERISKAEKTIDVAVYNNSRPSIINALTAAHQRGVRVRFITDAATQNSALDPLPIFPVVKSSNSKLMHNKFMVIDAESVDKSWVMGGSMNWSVDNVYTDANDLLFIQDQSLAKNYEIEMNEMWGSDGAQPNPAKARFGTNKKDNTAHQFRIGGIAVESYFSPSDQTTLQIDRVLRSANHNLQFALLTLTKNELGNTIISRHDAGVSVRGMIENINDNGSEYNHLISNGVAVRQDDRTGQLHHKCTVVDAEQPDSDPTVLTGSHNWSQTAENDNDENTLIFHDPTIATLYLQDFNWHWGSSSADEVTENQWVRLFPNPATSHLTLLFSDKIGHSSAAVRVEIWDATGRKFSEKNIPAGATPVLPIADLPAGFYYLKIFAGDEFAALPFQKN